MNERWVKVTLITGEKDEIEHTAWVNMATVPVVTEHKDGSKLEYANNYVYVCKEPPGQLLPARGVGASPLPVFI